MAEMTRCERCGGQNPADARFCIDCGASLAAATTGPTTRLAGVACPSCRTSNPENARFCVVCGRGLDGGAASRPHPAPARPTPRPTPPPIARPAPPVVRQSYPRTSTPPTWVPYRPGMRPIQPARPRGGNPGNWIFLVGLLVLLTSGNIWPGILIVVGFSMLFNQIARGRPDKGLSALVWLGGLALLFASGTFWPGILVLVFLSMLFGGWRW